MNIVVLLSLLFFSLYTSLIFSAEQSQLPEDNYLPYLKASAVFPQEKGLLEVIIQPEYDHGGDACYLYLYPQISYGMNDKWLVYINFIPYLIHSENGDHTSGIGDVDFGTQYSWMYLHDSNFSLALLFNFHVPTGDINKDLTDGFLRYEPSVLLAQDFIHEKWRTQFFSQIGFSIVQRLKKPITSVDVHTEGKEPAAHSFILNVGVAERSKKINYSLEFNWSINTWNNSGENNLLYITPGIYYSLGKKIAIGLGAPIGITKDADEYEIIGNLLIDMDTLPKNDDKDDERLTNKIPTQTTEKHFN